MRGLARRDLIEVDHAVSAEPVELLVAKRGDATETDADAGGLVGHRPGHVEPAPGGAPGERVREPAARIDCRGEFDEISSDQIGISRADHVGEDRRHHRADRLGIGAP